MAEDELGQVDRRRGELLEKLRVHLLPKDAADEKSAILEVRAGTGGDEASLFASDLFRMYSRYAEAHGWKTEIHQPVGERSRRIPRRSWPRSRARAYLPASSTSRASTACSASRHRGERAHPHLGGHGRSAAGGGGYRPRHPPRGYPHRYHARRRGRRTARQQTNSEVRLSASADRADRGLGREIAASEPPPSPCRCCAPASTSSSVRRQRSSRAAQRKGQIGSGDRSQRIRTHTFSAGPRHRPSHRPDAAPARRRARGHRTRRADRRADHRASGERAGGHG